MRVMRMAGRQDCGAFKRRAQARSAAQAHVNRAFFDTIVVVCAAHRTPDLKHETAQRLLERHLEDGSLVVSTPVLQETCSVLTGKKMLSAPASLAWVTGLASQEVVAAQGSFVLRALALSQRHQLSVWDDLMVQPALDSACEVLYTEDLKAGMRLGTLEIVNPFTLSAHEGAEAPDFTAPEPPSQARRRVACAPAAGPLRAPRRPRR